jgi:hypothetical protein
MGPFGKPLSLAPSPVVTGMWTLLALSLNRVMSSPSGPRSSDPSLPFVTKSSLEPGVVATTAANRINLGPGPGYKYLGPCTKSAMSHVELCWRRHWAMDESKGRRRREHCRHRQSALCVIPQARWVVLGCPGFPSHMLVASPGENHDRGIVNCSSEQSASVVSLATVSRSVGADNRGEKPSM